MADTVINYFRSNLRKELTRAKCGRFLPLWDDESWVKRETDINLDYIEANDFLIFLYQTKKDICCMENTLAQMLSNAIDKYFFILFDFQAYFNVFIQNKIYNCRTEIVNDVMAFKQNNYVFPKLLKNMKMLELFIDLTKRIEEWAFWKRKLIMYLTKIIISTDIYNHAEKNNPESLHNLMTYMEQLFDRGVNTS